MRLTPVLIVAAASLSADAGHSTPVYNPANGHYYSLLTGPDGKPASITWTLSDSMAKSLVLDTNNRRFRGHLVSITSEEENGFLRDSIALGEWRQYWIGARKSYRNGIVGSEVWQWDWISGEPWAYENWQQWSPGDIDGQNPLEPYGRILVWSPWGGMEFSGTWQDWPDVVDPAGYLFAIVEFEPELLVPSRPVVIGQEVRVSAPVLTAISGGPMVQMVDWGDGTLSQGLSYPDRTNLTYGQLSATHVYRVPGAYVVKMVAQMLGTGGAVLFSQASVSGAIWVSGGTGGAVTGGGWFWSAETGQRGPRPKKAVFNCSVRHDPAADAPTGRTSLHMEPGGIRFQSAGIDWLTVSGATARWQGTGTVDGRDGYAFAVCVVDAGQAGGAGQDRLTIRVWRVNDGSTVFDSQSGATAGSEPAPPLEGGSIQIHQFR